MLQSNLRRALASLALVAAVLLLSAGPAAAMARQGAEREAAGFSRVVERWGSLAWNFFAGLWEKGSSSMNPDGVMRASDGPH